MSVKSDCDRSSNKGKTNAGRYVSLVTKWNEAVRQFDFKFHRPYGGWLNCLIKEGYSPVAFLLPLLLLAFVVFGPVPNLASWECWLLFVGSLAGLGVRFVMTTYLGRIPLVAYQVAWIIFVALMVYLCGGETQASGGPYRHTLLPAVALLVPGLALAKCLSRKLANDLEGNCEGYFFNKRNRISPRPAPTVLDLSWCEILRNLIETPLRRPLATLAGPAVVVVLLSDSRNSCEYFVVSLAIAVVIGSFASVHRGTDAMWDVFRRFVAVGGQGVLTFLIVVMAVARLYGVSYVTTVLDQISWATLVPLLLCAYAFFWFYEYWTNRFLSEGLLELLRCPLKRNRAKGRPSSSNPHEVKTEKGRIAIHAGARFVVVQEWQENAKFRLYGRADLFEEFGQPSPEPAQDLRTRIRVYFRLATAAILVPVGAFIWLAETNIAQKPVLTLTGSSEAQASLTEFLGGRDRALMVAASGGGTRAAIYTTALMRGLYEIDALSDVVLLSGVSGGGVSLAYFAGHHRALLEGCDEAWMRYARFVGKPFIRDVLQGLGELRIALGDRIGKLLQESIHRHFEEAWTSGWTFGDGRACFGLILNASLAGSLDLSCGSYRDECSGNFVSCAQEYKRLTTRIDGGGRLVFTNLRFRSPLDRPISSEHPEIRFPYVIVNDPAVKLADAAALQANFPPVFPNAPVDDAMGRKRYWVTDGGAVENRGLVSLLLALRDSLEELKSCQDGDDGTPCPRIPDAIHILVAEASAGSTRFTQDRGAITTIAAREKLANLAIEGLMREVQRLSKNRVHLHYLAMPASLRVDGGFGTHWMQEEQVVLSEPPVRDPQHRRELTVDARNAYSVLYNLFRDPSASDTWYGPFDPISSNEVDAVWKRVRADEDYPKIWNQFIRSLNAD